MPRACNSFPTLFASSAWSSSPQPQTLSSSASATASASAINFSGKASSSAPWPAATFRNGFASPSAPHRKTTAASNPSRKYCRADLRRLTSSAFWPAARMVKALATILPLLGGGGRGEGELSIRRLIYSDFALQPSDLLTPLPRLATTPPLPSDGERAGVRGLGCLGFGSWNFSGAWILELELSPPHFPLASHPIPPYALPRLDPAYAEVHLG